MLVLCIKAVHEEEKGMSFGKLLRSVPAALTLGNAFRIHVSPALREVNFDQEVLAAFS